MNHYRYETAVTIRPSMCDFSARLSVPDAFALCMDVASEHAETMGIGGAAMTQRGLFWVTVRTRLRFLRRPFMAAQTVAATWPGAPAEKNCDRYYTLSTPEGKLLLEGVTHWAVMDLKTGQLSPVPPLYPADFTPSGDAVRFDAAPRLDPDFSAARELGTYTVRSTDIDFGGHMNNVAYVRALLGAFSVEEQKAAPATELEVVFLKSCYEGDTLSLRCRDIPGGRELALLRPDGAPAVLARVL